MWLAVRHRKQQLLVLTFKIAIGGEGKSGERLYVGISVEKELNETHWRGWERTERIDERGCKRRAAEQPCTRSECRVNGFVSVIRQHCLEERERAGIAGARKTLKEMPPDAQVEPLAPTFVNALVLVKCLASSAKADDALRAGVERRHEP